MTMMETMPLTLNVSNSLSQDVLLNLRVLQVLQDFLHDRVDQFLLLGITRLSFVANPRV